MTTFDRREEGFENLFVHDEELRFKAEVRRARLMADWAGGKMGKSGTDLQSYADDLAHFAVERGGAAALFERLNEDLRAHGASVSDKEIRERMARAMAEALQIVKTA